MKKSLAAIFSVIVMVLASCYQAQGPSTSNPAVTTPTTAAPTFTPAGGTYGADQSVTIGTTTANATIYYTTDGMTPTTDSTKYAGAISMAGNGTKQTIKAMAIASGYTLSSVATSAYNISYPVAAAPKITPSGGTYGADQSVTIATTTGTATIYYTTDGTTPTTGSTKYAGAISVAGNGTKETIMAIAAASGYASSQMVSASYIINYPNTVGMAALSPDGMTVTVNSVTVIKKTGSYQYTVGYTIKNNTTDKQIDEGTFALKNASTGASLGQYGFFGTLFPGDTKTRSYTFEDLLANTYDTLEYQYDFFGSHSDDPIWAVVYP